MSELIAGPGGFTYDPELLSAAAVEKITDRALLMLVLSLTPGYLTSGGIPKTKTGKARQIENAELQVLLRLMASDLGIRVDGGGYTESALEWQLRELAVERGLLTHHPHEYPVFRPRGGHANWCLWDVMAEDRKAREGSRRIMASPGAKAKYRS